MDQHAHNRSDVFRGPALIQPINVILKAFQSSIGCKKASLVRSTFLDF